MFKRQNILPIDKNLFVSLISGSEAGIATTAAIIAGVVIGTDDRRLVVVSTIVAIIVQAFNSSIGLILTAHTVDEIENRKSKDSLIQPLIQASLQFLTHLLTGILVLIPIVYVIDLYFALLISIAISLILLAWIGLYVGIVVRHTPVKNSVRSFLLGILVIAVGFVAGLVIN